MILPVVIGLLGGFGVTGTLYYWSRKTNADKVVQDMLSKQATITISFINYLQVGCFGHVS